VPASYGDPFDNSSGTLQSQGNLTARGQFAEIKLHTYELAGYQWDARGWLLRAIPYTDPELLHPEDLVWPTGINNFRIQYTAGYTTIPEGVQDACADLVSRRYYMTLRDPQLSHNVAAGTGSGWESWAGKLPGPVQAMLAPYRRHTIGTEQS
jgi:hypothetical protein